MSDPIAERASTSMPEGVEVPVASSNERWSEFVLEDGSVIKAKLSLLGVIRHTNEWDPNGNPIYSIQASVTSAVVKVEDEKLRRPQ